jgi:DUF1016 N-terminal domain
MRGISTFLFEIGAAHHGRPRYRGQEELPGNGVLLYRSIGRDILARQDAEGWGAKVIDRLAKDLGTEFPGVEGFSPRNLKYMRSLAAAWPDPAIVPQLVALLPRGHLRVLLDRVKDGPTRDWCMRAAVE